MPPSCAKFAPGMSTSLDLWERCPLVFPSQNPDFPLCGAGLHAASCRCQLPQLVHNMRRGVWLWGGCVLKTGQGGLAVGSISTASSANFCRLLHPANPRMECASYSFSRLAKNRSLMVSSVRVPPHAAANFLNLSQYIDSD